MISTPATHETAFQLMRQRRFWANMSLGVLLVAMGLVLGVCSSCQSVPDDPFAERPLKPSDQESYSQLVAEGGKLFETQPRNEERLRASVAKFDEAMKLSTLEYETLWQGARSCSWLAAYAAKQADKIAFAKAGIKYAQTALKVKPDATEGLFYLAVLSGYLADNDHSYGMDAVSVIEANCKKLIEANLDIAKGGAHRMYGTLLLRAPGPPTSIGSLRNAKKQLEAALNKAPDWPENHLYVAEMEFEWAKDRNKPEFAKQARERLEKYLLAPGAQAPQGHAFEFTDWQAKARVLLDANK